MPQQRSSKRIHSDGFGAAKWTNIVISALLGSCQQHRKKIHLSFHLLFLLASANVLVLSELKYF